MLYFIGGITLFCLLLLLYIMRLNKRLDGGLAPEEFLLPRESAALLQGKLYAQGRKRVSSLLPFAQGLYAALEAGLPVPEGSFPTLEAVSGDVRWLYDNQNRLLNEGFSVAEEIKRIREKLPADSEGNLRIFAVTEHFLRHNDGILHQEALQLFLQEIIRRQELTFGEIGLLPLFLRLQLLRMILQLLEDAVDTKDPLRCGLCIKNTVRSLLQLPDIDMQELVGEISPSETLLRNDPGHVYESSDKATRAEYKRRIALLARRARVSEYQVTLGAYELALDRRDTPAGHMGAFLFGEGSRELCARLGGFSAAACRSMPAGLKTFVYILLQLSFSAVLLLPFLLLWGAVHPWVFWLLLVFGFAPAFLAAQNIVNGIITRRVRPVYIPRLEREQCDREEYKTVIAVPALLSNVKRAEEVLVQLEEHFLGNRLRYGVFLLLGDLPEGKEQNRPEDAEIIACLQEGCKKLNEKYPMGSFAAFVRPRSYHEKNRKYMPWERKRGALEQLVCHLQGEGQDFIFCGQDENIFRDCRYILTVDADTILPPGSAVKLIGCMAHPLNRPRLNEDKNRVEAGYGLIQPRIGTLLPAKNRTLFARIFAPKVGIDTYACAVSEVYQDYFEAGSFCGKGIFSVEAYYRVLKGSIKEDTVLSHDLLEGELLRTGLAADIVLMDAYPAHLLSFAARLGRWTRGDWQLLGWLCSPRLRGISRWKLASNLLRSLSAPGLLLLLLTGIFAGKAMAVVWIMAVLAVYYAFITDFFSLLRQLALSQHARYTARDVVPEVLNTLGRAGYTLLFLPYESYVTLKSITLGLWRRFVSRRNVLQWVTAADAEKRTGLKGYLKAMWFSIVFAFVFYVLCIMEENGVFIGFVLAAFWCLAPLAAYMLSKPVMRPQVKLLPDETDALKLLAHRTLRFFTDSMTKEYHYLPPDNFQEKPFKGYAKRTSPTNMGLGLAAYICGEKMGALSPVFCLESLERTVGTMEKLEKWNGHLYNWYDLRNGKPLGQKYVSSVDSGNACACMHLTAAGLKELKDTPVLDRHARHGVADGLASVLDGLEEDMVLHLSQYAEKLYNAETAKEGRILLEQLLHDGVLQEQQALQYPLMLARSWAEMYDALAFPAALTEQLEELEDINLRPLISFLSSFPRPVNAIKELAPFFHEKLEEYLKDADRKKLALLTGKIEARFTEIARQAEIWAARLDSLRERLLALADAMELGLLYDEKKKLFSIGFDVEHQHGSIHFYDLLCSEARLTSYLAIATGQVPPGHWFELGRPFTRIGENPTALSWSGTMFEYFMPELFLRAPADSMLGTTNSGALQAQIAYGRLHNIPWGISESAFCAFDAGKEYKYRAFGVPETALCLCAGDMVVSPYSTMLALERAPREAMDNLVRLVELGGAGKYGMYEALDFARSLSRCRNYSIVYSYMAHHAGMSLCGLVNCIYQGALRKTFENIESIKAARTLLEERIPMGIPPRNKLPLKEETRKLAVEDHFRKITNPAKNEPQVQVLDNGLMRGIYTGAGGSALFLGDAAVTLPDFSRIREDGGSSLYIFDATAGTGWNMGLLPMGSGGKNAYAELHRDQCIYFREDGGIQTKCLCSIAGEYQAEIRRLTLTNTTEQPRVVEAVLAHELVLMRPEDYRAHPAFHGLFVETHFEQKCGAVMAKRRSRDSETGRGAMAAGLAVLGQGELLYETDRMAFWGRGRDRSCPQQLGDMMGKGQLGVPVQPILAAGKRMELQPGESRELLFVTAAGPDCGDVTDTIQKCSLANAVERQLEYASGYALAQVRAAGLDGTECKTADLMTACITLPTRSAFYPLEGGKELLWRFGISGDKPFVLVRFAQEGDICLLERILRIFEYVSAKGQEAELVLVDETISDYLDGAFQKIEQIILPLAYANRIYHLRSGNLTAQDDHALENFSCLQLHCSAPLKEQLQKPEVQTNQEQISYKKGYFPPSRIKENVCGEGEFYNGLGCFSKEGKAYTILLREGRQTPAPWVNVLCNEHFGCIAAENGGGYTWQGNSRQNKLTPWSNDPVANAPSEVVYLRDEGSGDFWSITNTPVNYGDEYLCTHGMGYTRYSYNGFGLEQTQTVFVHKSLPLKCYLLQLFSSDTEERRLSVTFFAKAVLGVDFEESFRLLNGGEHAGCQYIRRSGGGYMFLYMPSAHYTASSVAFFGRLGILRRPAAMRYTGLPPVAGTDGEHCLAGRSYIGVKGQTSFACVLGYAESLEEIEQYKKQIEENDMEAWLEETRREWEAQAGALQIKTPDRKLDILFNHWLLYQTLASRFFGRTGFYQAGGAYGFRDQLQDCLAIVYTRPKLVREHLLRCAAHQFPEGDVQHWWHPERAGIRTRMTDDLLFLPFVAARYAHITGDWDIFREKCPYLEGRPLGERHDLYEESAVSEISESFYMHCVRAVELAMSRRGEHGLPLIGTGDWNDALDSVGDQGRGESVWLGWFLYGVISELLPVCQKQGEEARTKKWKEHAAALLKSIEEHGWDGRWYRRAFTDEGKWLGSVQSPECKIDAISQVWAVLSGGGDPKRCETALQSMETELLDRKNGLLRLLSPPFAHTQPNPGYIQSYVCGVRENGGQYTHAAVWAVMAYASLGKAQQAYELLHMLNPINHSLTASDAHRYMAEPYVMAADIYARSQQEGRGGWTWYTGAASQLYTAVVRDIMGLQFEDGCLILDPCIPQHWEEAAITWHFGDTAYEIQLKNPDRKSGGVRSVTLDGKPAENRIRLEEDKKTHKIRVVL